MTNASKAALLAVLGIVTKWGWEATKLACTIVFSVFILRMMGVL